MDAAGTIESALDAGSASFFGGSRLRGATARRRGVEAHALIGVLWARRESAEPQANGKAKRAGKLFHEGGNRAVGRFGMSIEGRTFSELAS
jgi:hypothetical protein